MAARAQASGAGLGAEAQLHAESRTCQQTALQAAASLDNELLQSARHAVEHGERPPDAGSGPCASALFSHPGACALYSHPRVCCAQGLVVVPQQAAYIVERFGKFQKILDPGLNFLIPLVDRIPYVYSRKEEALSVPSQVRSAQLTHSSQCHGFSAP